MKSSSVKLLGRPKPKDDECPISYLLRLANANGIDGIYRLLKLAGLEWKNSRVPIKSILFGVRDIYSLLHSLGCDHNIPSLNVITQQFKDTYGTNSGIGPFSKYPKVCPECLIERGYARAEWLLTNYLICHEHHTLLVDINPKDNHRLSWYRPNLLNYDHENPITQHAEYQGQLFGLSELLSKNLYQQMHESNNNLLGLSTLSLSEFIECFHFLERYVSKQLFNKPCNPQTAELNELRLTAQITWKMFLDWPDSFHELLSKWIASGDQIKNRSGISRTFKDFYEGLSRHLGNPGITEIKSQLENHLSSSMHVALIPCATKVLKIDQPQTKYLNKNAAARILDCRPEKVSKLVRFNLLSSHDIEGRIFFLKADVLKVKEFLDNNWTLEEAKKQLGLSRYQLHQLLESGILKALLKPSPENRDWLIDKKDTVRLFKRLRNGASKENYHIGKSLEGIQKSGYNICNLIQAMKNKRLSYNVTSNVGTPKLQDFFCFTEKFN